MIKVVAYVAIGLVGFISNIYITYGIKRKKMLKEAVLAKEQMRKNRKLLMKAYKEISFENND